MVDEKMIIQRFEQAEKELSSFLSKAPSNVSKDLEDQVKPYLDLMKDIQSLETTMLEMAKSAGFTGKDTVHEASYYMFDSSKNVDQKIQKKWKELDKKRDALKDQVRKIEGKAQKTLREIQSIQAEDQRAYIENNELLYEQLQQEYNAAKAEVDAYRAAQRRVDLQLVQAKQKSKQPDLKALKNYSKNIGNVIKEAKKDLQKVNAQKRTMGRTSKWTPFQTSLDTSVKDTKIVGKQWIAGERNHKYSHPENQTPLTATQIAGYLYKGPRGKAGYSQDYGTMFHRLIEEYEKGVAKIGGSGSVTRKDMEEYLKNTYGPGKPHSAQDLADGAAYLKYGKAAESTDAMLKNFNQYLELRKIQSQMFSGKKVKTEQPLGATVNYKGHKIPVAGTVDQIVGSMITDLKTSKEVGPQYVAQLSILKYIAEANGIDTKGLKIFHTPLLGSNAKVLDINPLSKKEVETLMAIAYQQETGTNLGFTPDQIKKELAAIEKHSQQLIGGGTSIYQPNIGGDYYRSAVFNGKTLAQWKTEWTNNKTSPEEIKKWVSTLPEDQQSFFNNALFKRGEGGNFSKYADSKVLNDYRRLIRPELFGANGKAKSISEIAQDIRNGAVTENALSMPGKMIPGYLLAGHSLTDILGYISAAGPKGKEALIQAVSAALYSGINSDVQSKKYDTGKFIQSIKNRADIISPNSDKAEAYDLLTSYLINNSSLLDDSGDVQTSTEIAETQNFLASFAKSEDYKDYGFSEYDMDEKTYGLFSKVNYTENDIRNIKKRLEKYGSYDVGKQWSQIPHRLARATRFADLFDKTYKPLYEKYGEQYGFKNYENFISQVFERNPEQGKQYKTSIALQNLQTLYPDMDLIDILRNPDIIKKGDIRPEALGGKEMTWEMMNLLNILRTSPEDFLNEQRMWNEKGDTNSIRDVLSYQLAEGKMNWWDKTHAENWLLAGMNLDKGLSDYQKPELSKKGADMINRSLSRSRVAKNIANAWSSQIDNGHFGLSTKNDYYLTKGAALAQAAGLPKMFAGEFAPIFEALDNAYTAYSAKAFDLSDDISPEEEEALFSKTNFLKTAEAKKILSEKGPLGELIKKYNLNSSFFTDIMKDRQLQAWNDIEDQLEAEQEKKQKNQREQQRAEEFARQEQEAENQQYKIISARFRVTHNKNGEPLNKPYWSKDYQYAFANRSGQAIKPWQKFIGPDGTEMQFTHMAYSDTIPGHVSKGLILGENGQGTIMNLEDFAKEADAVITKSAKITEEIADDKKENKAAIDASKSVNVSETDTKINNMAGNNINVENATFNIQEASIQAPLIEQHFEGGSAGSSGSGGSSFGGSGKKDSTPKEKTPEEIAKEQDAAVAEYEKLLTRQGELENMQQRAQNRYKQVGLTPSQQKAIEARYAYTQSELDEVQKKIDDFDYSTIDPAVKKQIDARNAAKRHVEQQEIAAERPANMFEQLTMSFKNYMRHWLSIGMMYQIMGKIKKAIGQVVQAANQLDKVMTNLRIVTNDNREEAMELMRSYSNLGQQLAATTTEVASAANDWFNESRDQSKINSFNCWKISLRQPAAKPRIEEGSTTRAFARRIKWSETGSPSKEGEDIVWTIWWHIENLMLIH